MEKQLQNTPWARLEAVRHYAGIRSVYHFTRLLGRYWIEELQQIKNGHRGISLLLAGRIYVIFPEISLDWLLCGEGEMLIF